MASGAFLSFWLQDLVLASPSFPTNHEALCLGVVLGLLACSDCSHDLALKLHLGAFSAYIGSIHMVHVLLLRLEPEEPGAQGITELCNEYCLMFCVAQTIHNINATIFSLLWLPMVLVSLHGLNGLPLRVRAWTLTRSAFVFMCVNIQVVPGVFKTIDSWRVTYGSFLGVPWEEDHFWPTAAYGGSAMSYGTVHGNLVVTCWLLTLLATMHCPTAPERITVDDLVEESAAERRALGKLPHGSEHLL
eukprot:CAMPEP_0183360706 /NCGR_PEP_ID=MMETSP0164_2-20130417/55950_1 /TAXON_ID=221442 /ORGANISM="Coccolithus pelagicus ssp braarudi, Strain PLY182g" /LENGTH=245 /DNA_ID=CAMNT_0025535127 /DNA_START=152 /DNA_END=889 /DNA_ORIENTATION=-